MRRFSDFRKPFAETAVAVATTSRPNLLADELSRVVDQFVNSLKSQLANSNMDRRGVWDRVKGWWSNLWHGRSSQGNPYYWQNKLGDSMGATVESVSAPMPLEHYKVLHRHSVMLEEMLPAGAEKLQIMKTIDAWAKDFKTAVIQLANRHEPPTDAFPEPGKEPTPETTPAPEVKPEEPKSAPPEVSPETDEDEWKSRTRQRLKNLENTISPERYGVLDDYIEIGDRDRVERFLDFLEKHQAKAGEPNNPVEPPRTATMDNPEEVGQSKTTFKAPPPVGTKTWAELDPHEQAEWDRWGGGISGDKTDLARIKFQIHTLPWILRIGDPRLRSIISIRGQHLYSRLESEKRIESVSDPIKNEIDLARAVEQAKTLHDVNKKRYSDKNVATADRTKLRNIIKTRQSKKVPTSPPTSDPSDVDVPIPTPRPSENVPPVNRVATMDDVAPADTPPPEATNRVASMDLPPPEGDKNVKEDIEKFHAELNGMKDDIDTETHVRLKKLIDRLDRHPDKVEQVRDTIEKIKKEIEEKKNGGGDDDDELDAFENTIHDRTALVIGNFRRLARR